MKKLPILVDMDGTICDFVSGYYHVALYEHPQLWNALPEKEDIHTFFIEESIENPTPRILQQAADVVNHPTIFLDLPPIEGAVDGVKLLQNSTDREVFFLSAPHVTNFNSYNQKAEWIERHFGSEWVKRLMLVRDKTLVDGVVLIDDKPDPLGKYAAKWEHILYNQCYNQTQKETKGKYRMYGWSPESVNQLLSYINNK